MGVLRPEENNHPVFKNAQLDQLLIRFQTLKPLGRFSKFRHEYFSESRLDLCLFHHSQRVNQSRLVALCFISFVTGNILYYINWKINVIEKKWIANYGGDLPNYVSFWHSQQYQYWRSYFINLYKFKFKYFLEDQILDPLNDNVLNPRAFEIYQYKRLVRAMRYDDNRDNSFDFLNVGEDDVEEFDDYV
ncbi:UNKNOWN [Stylonychia lemnae]|uniref:Uncharacterized protein n=1 Tax=Stylonychia lemnae TaxID=5949 RepID=A0A078B0R8_STYLE|nr:UNKNOWN [Stylonychia lemnae]|eukprot:CDW88255.1 UNKNOWN [Stylonychia lemnae]